MSLNTTTDKIDFNIIFEDRPLKYVGVISSLWPEEDFDQSLSVMHLLVSVTRNDFSLAGWCGLVLLPAFPSMDMLLTNHIQTSSYIETYSLIWQYNNHKIHFYILVKKSIAFWWWILVQFHQLEYLCHKVGSHWNTFTAIHVTYIVTYHAHRIKRQNENYCSWQGFDL